MLTLLGSVFHGGRLGCFEVLCKTLQDVSRCTDEHDQRQIQFEKGNSMTPYAQVYHSTGETLGYAMGPCASCATYGDSTAQVTQDVKDRM